MILCMLNIELKMFYKWKVMYVMAQEIRTYLIDIIDRLVNEEILSSSDFTNFDTYLSYIKGKQPNNSR